MMNSQSAFASNPDHHERNTTIGVRALNRTIRGDEIENFHNLQENLTEKLKLDNWNVSTSHQHVHIFILNKKLNGNLSIRNTICVNIDLFVKVFGENDDEIVFNLKLYRWPQLQNLIEHLGSNVKREDCVDLDCRDNSEISRRDVKDDAVTFEFCAASTGTDTHDLHGSLTEHRDTYGQYDIDSFVKVEISESDPYNSAELQSPFFHGGPYTCTDCGKSFDQNAKLMLHKRVHQSQVCTICNESFTGKMDRHMLKHLENTKSYQCYICDRKYVNLLPLRKHMQLDHLTARENLFCGICKDGKEFKTKIYLNTHMKNRHGNEPTKRKQLPVENAQLEYVRETEERLRKKFMVSADQIFIPQKSDNRSVDTNDWKCTTCDKEFPTRRQFTWHIGRHDRSKWKKCQICDKSYHNVNRHIRNVHSNIRDHVCHLCGAAFKQSTTLKEHMETKHSQGDEFFCDICQTGKSYRSRSYLKKHLAKVHAKVWGSVAKRSRKPFYECNVCNEKLPSRYTLKSHISSKHNDGNTPLFHCKVCDKRFVLKSSLAAHEKLHAGNSYICQECGQSFNLRSYLRKHLLRHKGNKNKECTMCERRYVQNVDLRLHMKKVHGVVVPVKNTTQSV